MGVNHQAVVGPVNATTNARLKANESDITGLINILLLNLLLSNEPFSYTKFTELLGNVCRTNGQPSSPPSSEQHRLA